MERGSSFLKLFDDQVNNQSLMLQKGMYDNFTKNEIKSLPVDDVNLFSYHMQQLMSELGEVLDSDKRWKNFRNAKYDKENKLEEIADLFIVTMNVAMYSGFSGKDVYDKIEEKIVKVKERILSDDK